MINRGFTLIETLVAVLILASAIAGPLTIASKGLAAATLAKNQTAAEFLAQDAMEYIRFVRDTNRLSGNAWLTRLDACVTAGGTASCSVDSLADTITACSGACPFFVYQGAAASPFVRSVTITAPVGQSDCTGTNGCEAMVKVTVTWKDNVGGPAGHAVTIVENLFDWQ